MNFRACTLFFVAMMVGLALAVATSPPRPPSPPSREIWRYNSNCSGCTENGYFYCPSADTCWEHDYCGDECDLLVGSCIGRSSYCPGRFNGDCEGCVAQGYAYCVDQQQCQSRNDCLGFCNTCIGAAHACSAGAKGAKVQAARP